MEDTVRVPFKVEEDGSLTYFFPDCRDSKGYKVGPKEAATYHTDYWAALAHVMSFEKPEFRRKNANGNRGRVVCNPGDVRAFPRSHIQRMLSND